ncbi:MAG: Haloacetate dehalogenase [Pseudonocardiales bacterium]|nr:Haloacetate dehalogenase [Pseudonocardiales bacterium]
MRVRADSKEVLMTTDAPIASVRRFSGADGLTLSGEVWEPPATGTGTDGSKFDVVMLHGGGQTRGSWKRAGEQLAAHGHRVIALDSRGHGDSDWSPDAKYDMESMAADVLAVLDELGRPAMVVGASMGGLTALLVAELAGPEAVPALVLVDIVPRYEKSGSKRVREFMMGGMKGFASLEEAGDAIAAYLPHRKRPRSVEGLRKNLRQRADGRWYWHWDPSMMTRPSDDPVQRLERLEQAAKSLTVPTLLLWGGKSDVVSREGVEAMLELVPGAILVELPAAAHTAAGDDNDSFSQAVVEFVESVPAR